MAGMKSSCPAPPTNIKSIKGKPKGMSGAGRNNAGNPTKVGGKKKK